MNVNDLLTEYNRIWDKYMPTEINAAQNSIDDKLLDRGFAFQFDEGIKSKGCEIQISPYCHMNVSCRGDFMSLARGKH